jgi:hypothetical protein
MIATSTEITSTAPAAIAAVGLILSARRTAWQRCLSLQHIVK